MAADFPKPGQVFEYRYLWRWQKASGETEGRKPRPCCVAIVVQTDAGQTMLFIAPITSKPPASGRIGLQVPVTEAKRAKLDHDVPLWVMVDELNADILEHSYVLEDRVPRGSFSARFLDEIVGEIQAIVRAESFRSRVEHRGRPTANPAGSPSTCKGSKRSPAPRQVQENPGCSPVSTTCG